MASPAAHTGRCAGRRGARRGGGPVSQAASERGRVRGPSAAAGRGLVSGAFWLAAVAFIAALVISAPSWIPIAFGDVGDVLSGLAVVVAVALFFVIPAVVLGFTGPRPGNAALRRRMLVLDDRG